MEFGTMGLDSFTFVPVYNGNRDLSAEEQVSVEVVRPNTAQRLALDALTEAKLFTWRDQAMKGWLDSGEFGGAIAEFSANVLHVFRVVALHTRHWRNVLWSGRVLTDPLEICLRLPIPTGGEEKALIREVYDAIIRSSELSGLELKNYAGQCAGNIAATTPINGGGATATSATGGVAPRRTAAIPAGKKGLSVS